MTLVQWSLATKPRLGPGDTLLHTEAVSLVPRIMMGLGGCIGALGFWELILQPFAFSKLPTMGFLALPFIFIGLFCLALMLIALGYALMARHCRLGIDERSTALVSELDLVQPLTISWSVPLSRIRRLWMERDDFHETRETWKLLIKVDGKKHPQSLQSFSSKADAADAVQKWRAAITAVTGLNLAS